MGPPAEAEGALRGMCEVSGGQRTCREELLVEGCLLHHRQATIAFFILFVQCCLGWNRLQVGLCSQISQHRE